MITRILAAVEWNERTELQLAPVAALALATGACITILDALELQNNFYPTPQFNSMGLRQSEYDARRKKLEALARSLRDNYAGLRVSLELRQGNIITAARRVLRRGSFGLAVVALAANAIHDPVRPFPEVLLRSASCPIWLIPAAAVDEKKPILALVDNSNPEEPVVTLASLLARCSGSKLHLASYHDTEAVSVLDRIRSLVRVRDQLPARNTAVNIITGTPIAALRDFVEHQDIGCIFLRSPQRRELKRFLKSKALRSLFGSSRCSLVVVPGTWSPEPE